MERVQEYVLLGFVLLCVLSDLHCYRIRNSYLIAGTVFSVVCHVNASGLQGFSYFLQGTFWPIILLFPLFFFRALGAGDVKLFGMIGGFFGTSMIFTCILFSFLIASVLSVIKLLIYKNLKKRLQYFIVYVIQFLNSDQKMSFQKYQKNKEHIIYFSIPIFISTALHMGGIF